MSKLTQGGQFMTEKEGGSDVGTLTTTAVQEGDHWRLHGEKWFCSNADAEVGWCWRVPKARVRARAASVVPDAAASTTARKTTTGSFA
jgi:alkylation response protein AidB-like acyl-CoA dehydrogenase